MILLDPVQDACLVYLAADALQRAGYSVWPSWSPDLEGTYVHLYPSTDSTKNEISFRGGFGSEDISASRTLEFALSSIPDRRDVEFLVADVLKSPAFRARVGHVSAAESADQFVTSPIDPAQLRTICSPSPSPPRRGPTSR